MTKFSRLDACEDRKVVLWWRTQAFSQNVQGVIDDRVNQVDVSTGADSSVLYIFGFCTPFGVHK